jgi:hypothetical protein
MPTAFGSAAVPSADETVLPEGQAADAAVILGSATVAVGGAAVAVGAVPAAVGVVTVPDEPPHAARRAANPRALRGIQAERVRVTGGLR